MLRQRKRSKCKENMMNLQFHDECNGRFLTVGIVQLHNVHVINLIEDP